MSAPLAPPGAPLRNPAFLFPVGRGALPFVSIVGIGEVPVSGTAEGGAMMLRVGDTLMIRSEDGIKRVPRARIYAPLASNGFLC